MTLNGGKAYNFMPVHRMVKASIAIAFGSGLYEAYTGNCLFILVYCLFILVYLFIVYCLLFVLFFFNILESVASGKEVDAIYLDLSKAFDKVPHNLLLNKLEKYGIRGPLLSWFRSYLYDRKQRVVLRLDSGYLWCTTRFYTRPTSLSGVLQ